MQRPDGRFDEKEAIATGGTLFGNPLSMAAARATMGSVLTDDAYAHTHVLGARLADGIEKAIGDAGLPWTTHRFWPRSGVTFAPAMPRNALEAYAAKDIPLTLLSRVYLANRGVWDAIVGRRPDVRGARDRGGRRSLPRGVRLLDRGADGLGPAGRDALAFRDGG